MPARRKRKFLGSLRKTHGHNKYKRNAEPASQVALEPDCSSPFPCESQISSNYTQSSASVTDHDYICSSITHVSSVSGNYQDGTASTDKSAACMNDSTYMYSSVVDCTYNEHVYPVSISITDYGRMALPDSSTDHTCSLLSSLKPEVPEISNPEEPLQEGTLFEKLKEDVQTELCSPYVAVLKEDTLEILELYKVENKTSIKLAIHIDRSYKASVHVHRKKLSFDHGLWTGLPLLFDTWAKLLRLLNRLQKFIVCLGNPDEEFQDLTPIGCTISSSGSSEIHAYREGDFCAQFGNFVYNSSIRSVNCSLLVDGRRCTNCATYRRSLRARKQRLTDKTEHIKKDIVHSNYKHKDMSRQMLISKIKQQQSCLKSLQHAIEKQIRNGTLYL